MRLRAPTWQSPRPTVSLTIHLPGRLRIRLTSITLVPQGVTGAAFSDPKPTQVTSWIWTCVAGTGAICNPGPFTTNADFTDTLTIPSGVKVRYTVVATIDPAATVDMVNTATATVPLTVTDPNLANNSATDTDLHPIADLSAAISDQIDHIHSWRYDQLYDRGHQ